MKKVCKTAKELGQAVKQEADTIIVESDLKKSIITIKATGKVAWAVAIASVGASAVLVASSSATTVAAAPLLGPAAPAVTVAQLTASLPAAAPAAGVLGSAVIPAIVIAVAAGGVGALTTLRDKYEIVENNDKHIKLKRKKSFPLNKLKGK